MDSSSSRSQSSSHGNNEIISELGLKASSSSKPSRTRPGRWDSTKAAPKSSTKPQDLGIEEQIARANVIAEIDIPEFMPQSFASRRTNSDKPEKTRNRKAESGNDLTGVLAGPIEDLISVHLLPGTEEERTIRQAASLTHMRQALPRQEI